MFVGRLGSKRGLNASTDCRIEPKRDTGKAQHALPSGLGEVQHSCGALKKQRRSHSLVAPDKEGLADRDAHAYAFRKL